MGADALVMSATMVLNMQYSRMFVFHSEGFQLEVPMPCFEEC